MFDYMTLRLIWWAILGLLLVGFAVFDGFDLGVAMLHPFVAKKDVERRVLINAIGPVWEGNQVWFILGGGAVFAAWPPLYAASFSGFYLAMLLVLLGLILRPVSITFRSKREEPRWRATWDWLFFVSGALPSLLFGVAFGNLFLGVPYHYDQWLRLIYEGGLLGLLRPFALLCGLVSVTMLVMQGASWLAGKSEGEISERARRAGAVAALLLVIEFIAAGLWIATGIEGYRIETEIAYNGPSTPFGKEVMIGAGEWLLNYARQPFAALAPLAGLLGAIGASILLATGSRLAILASSVSIAGVVATAGFSLFPFLMPSSSHPGQSLTVWDASSSQSTLGLMLVAVIFFLPIILAYTSWVYWVLRGPVTEAAIERGDDHYY
ncbi:cytochrome d ubiquinol oxidase subunit II [Methylocystis parvus]|uniref:Cytochrome d ubiquinol oxidase subunit II n=1 Tax=Methylocystis parvus TaxID=134 RepID=A0A6B8M4A4_9HYPH|nr:cytochrome d ubiquinol oxidase subunit II [Methylocystis parvus]QGM97168.1 cytochrome d ubiquinol oxidase subunit II [Methylocystis parvus]WBJ98927.1 cytochrome d ubiquinol oxidase subunit II [Methylocystis parvus OBBP]